MYFQTDKVNEFNIWYICVCTKWENDSVMASIVLVYPEMVDFGKLLMNSVHSHGNRACPRSLLFLREKQ